MVEVLPHRALHSITKHLSEILKFYLKFSQMQCKPLFKHCHSTVYKCLLLINALDAIIDKKLMQVKPRFYQPFFPMKHEKWITKKNEVLSNFVNIKCLVNLHFIDFLKWKSRKAP